MLITIKTLLYLANTSKNGFLNVFSTGNLLNYRALRQYRACAKERKRAVKISTQKFSMQKTDFMLFSGVSCQKRIEMNIEWIRIAILVLISKPLNRSFDNTVYRSRPLVMISIVTQDSGLVMLDILDNDGWWLWIMMIMNSMLNLEPPCATPPPKFKII